MYSIFSGSGSSGCTRSISADKLFLHVRELSPEEFEG